MNAPTDGNADVHADLSGNGKSDAPARVLTYAAPPRTSTGVWAAAVLLATALGLIALGGCFLIGVMLMITEPITWTPASYFFVAVLYLLAFLAIAGALWLMYIALRSLLRILRQS